MPLKHIAVLMSYLTFAFEVARHEKYAKPAWGVTANLLMRRSEVRFDEAYARTGGGEDVDFCLRSSERVGMSLKACPSAEVCHDFWHGS
eukprot:CAMPEP_0198324240 /NCGR_PEP_ID=MMETSP1450-20131203/12307_1 /TAXON_ID=753684 ORGANISM="Madagascaria erythrocladiodes, Strain CCMP3234" /NCGR_SAMPLE_ID=MMETSP1450 /ASSEMBLY_ACC=CAM_ASM_001115 /LENGTH=88 /DNA_ID=CAMNT_0044028021 /DNA_START=31 /DNA_END=294 /DNA_ORIENTATION=+